MGGTRLKQFSAITLVLAGCVLGYDVRIISPISVLSITVAGQRRGAVTTISATSFNVNAALSSGDFISGNVNSSAGGQLFYFTVITF